MALKSQYTLCTRLLTYLKEEWEFFSLDMSFLLRFWVRLASCGSGFSILGSGNLIDTIRNMYDLGISVTGQDRTWQNKFYKSIELIVVLFLKPCNVYNTKQCKFKRSSSYRKKMVIYITTHNKFLLKSWVPFYSSIY